MATIRKQPHCTGSGTIELVTTAIIERESCSIKQLVPIEPNFADSSKATRAQGFLTRSALRCSAFKYSKALTLFCWHV